MHLDSSFAQVMDLGPHLFTHFDCRKDLLEQPSGDDLTTECLLRANEAEQGMSPLRLLDRFRSLQCFQKTGFGCSAIRLCLLKRQFSKDRHGELLELNPVGSAPRLFKVTI